MGSSATYILHLSSVQGTKSHLPYRSNYFLKLRAVGDLAGEGGE